jgi:hypothetical protein
VSTSPSGLSPGTTYHFRLVATNSAGTSVGADQMLTTLMTPSVTTGSATSMTETTATLNGSVDPNGLATTYRFEYGTTTLYGAQSPVVEADAGSASSAVAVSTALIGLSAGTTYHYRLVATNAAGPTFGSDQTLTTLSGGTAGPEVPPATTETATTTGALADGSASTGNPATAFSRLAPTLAVPRQRRSSVLRHGLRFSVGCSTGCSIASSLLADTTGANRLHLSGRKPIVVGRAHQALNAPATVKLVLRLTHRARIALARTRSVTLRLKVVVTDSNGARYVLTRRVTIRR